MRRRRGEKSADADAVARIWVERPVYVPAERSGGHRVDDDVHPELGVVVTLEALVQS
jgi:hypothetical protein